MIDANKLKESWAKLERLHEMRDSFSLDNGQVVETPLLDTCPFCGGEPYVQVWEMGYGFEARTVCRSCHVATSREYESGHVTFLPTGEDITRLLVIEKAIAKWNRRT